MRFDDKVIKIFRKHVSSYTGRCTVPDKKNVYAKGTIVPFRMRRAVEIFAPTRKKLAYLNFKRYSSFIYEI